MPRKKNKKKIEKPVGEEKECASGRDERRWESENLFVLSCKMAREKKARLNKYRLKRGKNLVINVTFESG